MNINDYKVGLFVPCDIDQFAPETAWNTIHLLEGIGLEVFYPDELTGSGMELYNQGDIHTAKMLGEKMIEMYEGCTHVVSLSSATVAYAQLHFATLFHNTTMHNEYRGFIEHFVDLSDFLVNTIHYTPTNVFPHRVAFMDNCQTVNDYRSPSHPSEVGLRREPRELLKAVPELELVEIGVMPTKTWADPGVICCGYGGLFANRFTVISDNMAERKINEALAVGAQYITSTETGCLLHLKSYAEENRINIKFAHIADIIYASPC